MSLEAGRTPVPAADFHDSGEYDSGECYCADNYTNRDGQRIYDEPDASSRWSRSNSLMFYLRVVLT